MRILRGFSLLEFVVVLFIMAIIVYALMPRVSDALKLAHEQAVENTGAAFRENVFWAHHQWQALATRPTNIAWKHPSVKQLEINAAGFPNRTELDKSAPDLTPQICANLWSAMLAQTSLEATTNNNSPFRALLHYEKGKGLGCLFRYRKAESMAIYYYPVVGHVYWKNCYDGEKC